MFLLRTLHNYTQQYVAEQLNIAPSTYVSMEQGVVNISYARLEAILAIYNQTLQTFFAFTVQDVLDVVNGKSVVSKKQEAATCPGVMAKMEALNKLLLQLLQVYIERFKDTPKHWGIGNK